MARKYFSITLTDSTNRFGVSHTSDFATQSIVFLVKYSFLPFNIIKLRKYYSRGSRAQLISIYTSMVVSYKTVKKEAMF